MRKIWLDTDPGFDDWFAMLVLADDPGIDWLGTSVVAGNAPLESTWRNARRIAHFHGWTWPMHAGCDAPLVAEAQVTAQSILGEDGMRTTGVPLPAAPDEALPALRDGVDALISAVMRAPGEVTVMPIGPLTNVATAMQREPRFAGAVAEIVLMGGSTDRGNHTAAAEFNIGADPEAAAVVFDSSVPLRMFGLNLCHQVTASMTQVDLVRTWPGAKARCFAGYLEAYVRLARASAGQDTMPIFDASVASYLREPQRYAFAPARVEIELEGKLTRGMTVCEFRPHRAKPQVEVAMAVDDGHAAMASMMASLERQLREAAP
jgi:purine nucleosidase